MIERETIDDFGRVYYGDEGMYPSVTTVINRPWEEDGYGLQQWKKRNDGTGDTPYHLDIRDYARHRGTLIHYALLNPLASEELWSDDEQGSLDELKEFGDYHYHRDEEPKDAFERYQTDLEWAKRQWKLVCNNRGIDKRSIIDVERRGMEHDYPRYAGQFDLLYEDPDGNVVLSDIKTSKSVSHDKRLQVAAYTGLVDYDVDRMEILKLHPDYEWVTKDGYRPVEIDSSDDWNQSIDELYDEFIELAEEANEQLEEQVEQEE